MLTPNAIMWGQEAYTIEDIELDGDEVTKLQVRLNEKRQHVWQMWKKEFVTASWKVTGSKEARVITQRSERSYLSSVTRRTKENGRKVVF